MSAAKVANFLLFQFGWFLACWGAAVGWPALGPIWIALWLAAHLWYHQERSRGEFALLASAGLLGYAADSALIATGLIVIPEQAGLLGPAPLWLVALWMGFAATLRHSLSWLQGRYGLAAALGALAGPLAYYAGASLGAASLPAPLPALLAVALEWALALPLLLAVSRWTAAQRRQPFLGGVPNPLLQQRARARGRGW